MEYNYWGNTEIEISKLGFGVAKLPLLENHDADITEISEMVKYAVENGINYFDIGDTYVNGQCFKAMRIALEPYKDIVHIGYKMRPNKVKTRKEFRKVLLEDLESLGLDHFEFFLFWGINKKIFMENVVNHDLLEEVKLLKEERIIENVGFSFHDAAENMKDIIDYYDQWKIIICQFNLFNQINLEGMKYAKSKGIGIVIMGPLGGGSIRFSEINVDVKSALSFVMNNSYVDCTLTGSENLEMLKENIRIANMNYRLSDFEINMVMNEMKKIEKLAELYCTGYRYCQVCPKGIDIPYIFKLYNMSNVYNLHAEAIYEYTNYCSKEKVVLPTQCIRCKKCMQRCPQKLAIPAMLKYIVHYFKILEKRFDIVNRDSWEEEI